MPGVPGDAVHWNEMHADIEEVIKQDFVRANVYAQQFEE